MTSITSFFYACAFGEEFLYSPVVWGVGCAAMLTVLEVTGIMGAGPLRTTKAEYSEKHVEPGTGGSHLVILATQRQKSGGSWFEASPGK
jgi:hypothetical protein